MNMCCDCFDAFFIQRWLVWQAAAKKNIPKAEEEKWIPLNKLLVDRWWLALLHSDSPKARDYAMLCKLFDTSYLEPKQRQHPECLEKKTLSRAVASALFLR